MKKILLSAICILSAAFFLGAAEPPMRSSSAFQAGESLVYGVQYSLAGINTDVASATISLEQQPCAGQNAYHAKIFAQTAKFFDVFFPIREDFQSWFTIDRTLPLKATRDTKEGKYYIANNLVFDYASSSIASNIKKKSGEKNITIPMSGPTFDLTTLLYYVRNIDFTRMQQGVTYTVSFLIDDDVYNLGIVWNGREVKKIKGIGNVNALKLTASSLTNVEFSGDPDTKWVLGIYLSDDDSRVILSFDAPISVGRVAGTLRSYSGLKTPLTAIAR